MAVEAEGLDTSVALIGRELEERDFPRPGVLGLCATGVGFLPERLSAVRVLRLAELSAVPEPWCHAELVAGRLEGLHVWWLDDLSAEAVAAGGPPWVRGWPCWLAAARGARVLVHTSAGAALPRGDGSAALAAGSLALVRDHVNFSGRTPLAGLGPSRLGPLFPDPSRLHDAGLRQAAARAGARLGLDLVEVVAACTVGPGLDTPAERAYYARAGADVAVQGLEAPLLSAVHAGLVALAIVAVTDTGEGRADLVRLLERSSQAAPALEDLLVALAPDLDRTVRAMASQDESR